MLVDGKLLAMFGIDIVDLFLESLSREIKFTMSPPKLSLLARNVVIEHKATREIAMLLPKHVIDKTFYLSGLLLGTVITTSPCKLSTMSLDVLVSNKISLSLIPIYGHTYQQKGA